ncbi:MAG: GntR family transcriptional regulator [Caldilineaceae bacterium]|nr:GntR family transcriptional regulator [Caldilineaceae bacterium]
MSRLNRFRLIDDVCRVLEGAILSGKMRPGERLVVTQLADQYNVSQSTIREALLMLDQRGLVVSKPRRGTFVTLLSEEEALELCQSRALLEAFAATTGADRVNADVLAAMNDCLIAMGNCSLPKDLPELIRLDLAFHRSIIELGDSTKLIELWSSLNGQIGALILRGVEQQELDIDDVVRLHRLVIDALATGQPAVAQQALVEHYIREEADNIHHFTEIPQVVSIVADRI